MTPLATRLGLSRRELVAIVGGGGKSTLLFRLGEELAATGSKVVLTTTTKMGRDQADVAPTVCWSADTRCVIDALDKPGPVMLLTGGDDHKITGPAPEIIDHLFDASGADHIIVEADGSHGRPLKAPAAHEPVVPSATTTVVIVMGVDAVGHRLADVVHRVEVAERFTGLPAGHILTPHDCAQILLHPDGAFRVAPPASRIVVGITKIRNRTDIAVANEIAELVTDHPGITACVPLG